MKNNIYELILPIEFSDNDIKIALKKKGVKNLKAYTITRKSLDARKKGSLLWNISVEINTLETDFNLLPQKSLNVKYKNRNKKIIVVGSGPSGIFSSLLLLQSGFNVTLIERGPEVDQRDRDITNLLKNAVFNSSSNFAFGEGGAGTFSDGKLTSRSKHISNEKDYILSTFINNGAPSEIFSMVHPHLGSDNLKVIVKSMRNQFINLGGEILFDTEFLSFNSISGLVKSVETSKGVIDCDYLILGTGHSSFNTYRELMNLGVKFRNKNFAIGFRAEHNQSHINKSQWGVEQVKGLKAAEYRLVAKTEQSSVFSFCMCPGGTVVPAAATTGSSVVNGMSNYMRSGKFANAAVVASFDFEKELKREVSPKESLDLLQHLEEKYYSATGGFSVPAMSINSFINGKCNLISRETSYALGLTEYDLTTLLPSFVINPLKQGLIDFNKKIKGYEDGIIMGLESKTSAPIQVLRNQNGLCQDFYNLYFCGEGSGWAGGIVSSGADGLKAAQDIIDRN
ncbi:MAG: FAD-dependent oxidoreductase [Spirochaetales bacterium]|nr:FAD-dependent oxidoreductase [Spirochaetales bacterium]